MKHARRTIRPWALGAALGLALSIAGTGAPARARSIPSYATGEESIRGRILSLQGRRRLELRDERGFIDTVTLHDGTVINPTGLRLAPGQSVTITGHAAGKAFVANRIDTPYTNDPAAVAVAPVPYPYYPPYGYYGPYAYPVPYAYYGYPYSYRRYGVRFGFRYASPGFGFHARF